MMGKKLIVGALVAIGLGVLGLILTKEKDIDVFHDDYDDV
jgi:hypothetical protein